MRWNIKSKLGDNKTNKIYSCCSSLGYLVKQSRGPMESYFRYFPTDHIVTVHHAVTVYCLVL